MRFEEALALAKAAFSEAASIKCYSLKDTHTNDVPVITARLLCDVLNQSRPRHPSQPACPECKTHHPNGWACPKELERFRADSALLDELLDPEGPFRVTSLWPVPKHFKSGGTVVSLPIHTRADIDEVLKGKEPNGE